MSKSIKSLFALSLLALVAACDGTNNAGNVDEFVVADPGPITVQPTYTSKYN